jgi:ABC-2 type transport system ATP-binding protein
MIVIDHVNKRYGSQMAVDDLSFEVKPGVVTGFLGPNGAGKSTTMRMIIGLDRPTSGRITVNGRRYEDLPAPLHEVGALLEAKAVHPGRSARDHLLAVAATTGIPRRRVDETLDLVGLTSVAGRRAGAFSLGMSASPARCSATRRSSSSTSRSTAWIPRAFCGSVGCWPSSPRSAGRCSSPRT